MGASAKRKEERAQKYGHLRSVFTEEAITTSSKDRSQLQPESESSNEENAGDSFSGISSDRNENAREEELGKLDTAAKCAAPPRFICFVGLCSGFSTFSSMLAGSNEAAWNLCLTFTTLGNLPYSATEASVKRHFASTKPISTRLGTNKETGRCRGFAFLEYESRTAQQACLLSFHHTHFLDTEKQLETSEGEGEAAGSAQRDEEKEGRGWRRINVELT